MTNNDSTQDRSDTFFQNKEEDHIIESKKDKELFHIFNYSENQFQEMKTNLIDDVNNFRDSQSITWINVDGICQENILTKIGSIFGIHHLVLEDILDTTQRPKVEDYENYLYIVVKMIYNPNQSDEIISEQVSIILGDKFVISFQEEKKGDVFEEIRNRIRIGKGHLRKAGADYLVYSLLDAIVDNYFLMIEHIGDQLEELEDELVDHPSSKILSKIHFLKRNMINFRTSVWPMREVIGSLERRDFLFIKKSTIVYLRDIYDHITQLIETIETDRELISSMIDMYLSSINNRLNEVMKVLTMIATIFMPLSFIAGIYGMNFHFMPELQWNWGYPVSLITMGGIALIMLFFFKKKKWL
ncbi:MAG: magnesium/cobalt transporter CorA [Candidatus Atribacteria bacterium]|nr:magnesium/cobalt transporter CorA [Candidatus Atribacteria bacterium]